MLIPLLCLLPSFSLPAKARDERSEMVRIVRMAAKETERAANALRPDLCCDYLTQIADSLEGVDDAYAMKIIDRDWKLAKSNADQTWQDFTNIGAIASRINAPAGADLINKIPKKYKNEGEASTLAYSLWYRQPSKAAHYLNEGPDILGFHAFVLAGDLAILREDIALSFLKMLRPDRRDELAYLIASNLNEEEKKRFALGASKLVAGHSLRGWSVLHPDASAADLESGSKMITDRFDYVSIRMLAAKAYFGTNRSHAYAIADGLCQEAKRDPGISHFLLLPEIGRFDTPTVRAYITEHETNSSAYPFLTIGAWSFLDIDKARRQLDTILAKNTKTSGGRHGESLAPGLADLLKNMIMTYPEEAADRLGKVSLHHMGRRDRQEMNSDCAVQFVREQWKKNEARVRRFCLTPSPWQKFLGRSPTLIVDFFKAKDALLSAKHPTAKDLKLFQALFQANDLERSFTADYTDTIHEIIMRTAATNPSEAARMIEATSGTDGNPEFFCDAFEAARHLPFTQRRPLFEEAVRRAKTSNDNLCHWPKIAATAKRSWQRLQPWPPAH